MKPVRNLIIVLGDQLDAESAAFDGFDPKADAVHMAEAVEEASYIRQHKIRLVLFFSAMRHFRDELSKRGTRVHYQQIDDAQAAETLASALASRVRELRPAELIVLQPGDYRVQESLKQQAKELGLPLQIRNDRHFYTSDEDFEQPHQILENFYRKMRQKHGILMNHSKPLGAQWNFDKENRKPLTAIARKQLRPPRTFAPDAVTREVMQTVERLFANSPGRLDLFDYPVTRADARLALDDFIAHRLPTFGAYQDAMATGEPYLFHSRLSSALNLHLLRPAEAVEAAVAAYESGKAPLNSVEGYVRQVLGWREYVRATYWRHMPGYRDMNALGAELPVPRFFWTGETDMNCVRNAVGGLIDHAYAHHIHRLMVLGLYSLLLGVVPLSFHEWHLSMLVDAIDWVSLPNALGMSQYGDGGIMGTKPYCASGNYIHRMSDYCQGCRYNPKESLGEHACPFTTLYWDFLARNREQLAGNHRMLLQIQNVNRMDKSELRRIQVRADGIKNAIA